MGELYLPLEGLIDPEAERKRLTKELEKTDADIAQTEKKLANPDVVAKAPPERVQEWRDRLETLRRNRTQFAAQLGQLN